MSSVAYPYTRTRSAQMIKRKDTQDSVHSGPEAKRPKRAVSARNTRSTPGSQVVVELTAARAAHADDVGVLRTTLAKVVKDSDAAVLKVKNEYTSDLKILTQKHLEYATKLRHDAIVKHSELFATNEQLTTSNCQLFATTINMDTTIGELTASNEKLTAELVNSTELSAINRGLSVSNSILTTSNRHLFTSNAELAADHTAGLSTSSDLTTRLTAEIVTSTELRSANVRLLESYKQLEGKSGSEYAALEQQYAGSLVAIKEKNDELYREWMMAADNVDVLNTQRLAGLERERVTSLVIKQTAAAQNGEITALQVLAGTVKEQVRANRAIDLQTIASLRAEVEASHRKDSWGVGREASC